MARKIKKSVKNPWFRKRDGNLKDGWGFIPINFKGWIALLLLVGLNVFAAQYFSLNEFIFNNWLKFGVVFFLSFAVFVIAAKRKTKDVKR